MCCEIPTGHARQHAGCSCYCHSRRFLTKKEQIERLEEYSKSLAGELAGLKEYIKELKKES